MLSRQTKFVFWAVFLAILPTGLSRGQSLSSAPIPTPFAEILYDNSNTGETNFFASVREYGDEIILRQHPINELWIVTGFFFEYFGDFTPQGDESGRLRLYLNDGPRPNYPPKTILYESAEFTLSPGFQTRSFTGINFVLPDDFGFPRFTWAVEFKGLRGAVGDQAGLIFRPTPSVGHSFKDLWVREQSGWVLQQIIPANPNLPVDPITNPDPVENFGARVIGIPTGSTTRTVSIAKEEGKLVLRWVGTARLQTSGEVSGVYRDVIGAASPYTVDPADETSRFWRLATGAAPAAFAISIHRVGPKPVIEWPGGGTLQSSDVITGPFRNVEGATSPYESPAGTADSGARFWRVAY